FVGPVIDQVLSAPQISYSHPAPLAGNRQYWWRVTASNVSGEAGPSLLPSRTLYTGTGYPATLYVDGSAPAGGEGTSWSSPLRELATALEMAWAAGGAVTE